MSLRPFDPAMADADLGPILERSPWRELAQGTGRASSDHERRELLKLLVAHGRLIDPVRGELIVRAGDYGHSAYFILEGSVRVVLDPAGLRAEEEGRVARRRGRWLRNFRRLVRRKREPEARLDPGLQADAAGDGDEHVPIVLHDLGVVLNRTRTARIPSGEMFGEIGALCRMPRTASVISEDNETELLQIRWQGLRLLRRRFPAFKDRMDEVFRSRSLRQHLQAGFGLTSLGDTPEIRRALTRDRVGEFLELVLEPSDPTACQLTLMDGDVSLRCLAASLYCRSGEGVAVFRLDAPAEREVALVRGREILARLAEQQPERMLVLVQPQVGGRLWSWSIAEDERGGSRVLRELWQPLGETPEALIESLVKPLVLEEIVRQAEFHSYGEFEWKRKATRMDEEPVIASEGDHPDGLLLVRAGFARLSRSVEGQERTVSYLGPGRSFGLEEIAHNLRTPSRRVRLRHSLRGLGYVDVIWLPTSVVERHVIPALPEHVRPRAFEPEASGAVATLEAIRAQTGIERGLLEFLVDQRFTNGTAAMLIDMDRCTRCDDCVRACAASHDDNPRFLRHGPRHGRYMIANACMHCADPVCMIGCPTGAISRGRDVAGQSTDMLGGQVIINDKICIGCDTCARGCPYDNIRMVEIRSEKGVFFRQRNGSPQRKATKCDLCFHLPQGPACERACPHDALARVDLTRPESLRDWIAR